MPRPEIGAVAQRVSWRATFVAVELLIAERLKVEPVQWLVEELPAVQASNPLILEPQVQCRAGCSRRDAGGRHLAP